MPIRAKYLLQKNYKLVPLSFTSLNSLTCLVRASEAGKEKFSKFCLQPIVLEEQTCNYHRKATFFVYL